MMESKTRFKEFIAGKNGNNKATSTKKSGVTEYGVTNASLLYENTTYIDAATKAALYQWFMDRIINTEEQDTVVTDFDEDGIPAQYFPDLDYGRFIGFFNRTLLNDEYRYKELLRIERTEFDPMIADYLEEWASDRHDGSNSKSGSTSATPSEMTETSTRTDNLTETGSKEGTDTTTYGKTASTNMSVTDNTDKTGTHNTDTTNTTEDRTKTLTSDTTSYNNFTETDVSKQAAMAKSLPNAISYGGATAGSLPALDWGTGTGQNQTEGQNTHTTDGDVVNTHSHDNEVSSTGNTQIDITEGIDRTINTSGTVYSNSGADTKATEVTDTKQNTGTQTFEKTTSGTAAVTTDTENGTDAYVNESKRVHSGRQNTLPQDAMPKAINYIKKSRAFDWLKSELDSCFLQIL